MQLIKCSIKFWYNFLLNFKPNYKQKSATTLYKNGSHPSQTHSLRYCPTNSMHHCWTVYKGEERSQGEDKRHVSLDSDHGQRGWCL